MAPALADQRSTPAWSRRSPIGENSTTGAASAAVGLDRRQAARQRLGHHHHAGAAAEGAVVDAPVVALGEIAQVPQAHVDLPGLVGTARHARRQEGREQFGKQGDDVEAHGAPQ
jgi:hypothetical protein